MRALFGNGHRVPVLCRYDRSLADGMRLCGQAGTALADFGGGDGHAVMTG
jgi:hypothetical protein